MSNNLSHVDQERFGEKISFTFNSLINHQQTTMVSHWKGTREVVGGCAELWFFTAKLFSTHAW